MIDEGPAGAVPSLVQAARRTASSMRDRLSADASRLLDNLYASLYDPANKMLSEEETHTRAELGLEALAAFAGFAQENMNRVAGWRFLDMGKRVERGISTCRFMRMLGGEGATLDCLSVVLDLVDSQITYRSRYLEGVALAPVRDLVMLDPYNPRSVAFQIEALKQHLAALPSLRRDGLPETPHRLLVKLAAEVETADAADLDGDAVFAIEQSLRRLADAVADRFFLQGPGAKRSEKLSTLA
jgi:uncharacterized alpha-E superfamily protein